MSLAIAAGLLITGCVVEAPYAERETVYIPPPRPVYVQRMPPPGYSPGVPPPGYAEGAPPPGSGAMESSGSVVSVYVDPPLYQPPPIAVAYAPPPMLVEYPPPQPFFQAVWIGGYWVWDGDWVWAAGRWAPPPRPGYYWVHPYYEHRDTAVVFITGHWCAPDRRFEPPP
ncbi:MAG: hypothetical protein KGI67_13965, partial [Pseudomonadota bacterium]|nr:hypothetical protein [Pseudomonadota bacterium]